MVREATRADRGGGPLAGADGLVTREPGVALVARGADCPLVLLHDPEGEAIAVLHAGWKGIVAGVLTAGRAALGAADPTRVRAWLGPCAGPCCYEVGEEVARLFPAAAVRRGPGKPRLDLPAAVEAALGLPLDRSAYRCTVCSPDFFSHRRDGTSGRHALLAALR